jgi:hypothetical protein
MQERGKRGTRAINLAAQKCDRGFDPKKYLPAKKSAQVLMLKKTFYFLSIGVDGWWQIPGSHAF